MYFKLLTASIALGAMFTANAQVNNVGIGTNSPEQSAVLDIQSADKGLLIPRMTAEQRNVIAQPADGLMIYQTGEKSGFFYFDGKISSWSQLSGNEVKAVAAANPDNWSITGNTGVNAANFIGTPAGVPINFKIGADRAGFISPTNRSVFFGYKAGNVNAGDYNLGLGYETLLTNSTGGYNMAIGFWALKNNITGSQNSAIGNRSLEANTSGNFNVAVGSNALYSSMTSSNNIAIGRNALSFKTSGNNNVAIGNDALKNNLTGTGNVAIGSLAGADEANSNKLYIANSNTPTPLIYGDFSAKYVTIGDVSPALRNQGVATGGYNLLVKGGILTEKVKVALAAAGTDWADYVFEPNYKLMSLEEVESFTKENKHLPNVPSADEMINSGLDVAQTSKMFMEKIEELTLYMIELNKQIKQIKAENELLKLK